VGKPAGKPRRHPPTPFAQGKGLDGLKRALAGLGPFDSARQMHDAVEKRLVCSGYTVKREYPAKYRADDGSFRHGRIDLLAEKGELRFALELDLGRPRTKSIKKLQSIPGAARVVLLRTGGTHRAVPPAGVDAVFVLPIKSENP
jgi:hypothetical protein